MPILIKDFYWSETDENVSISIVIKNINKKNVSILSSSRYLKVSQPPFFWETFLKEAIDVKKCTAIIGDDVVTFSLIKQQNGFWGSLCHPASEDKSYCQKMRQEALSEIEETAKKDRNQKKIEKSERERLAVKLQMDLEDDDRKRIEKIKQQERNIMIKEIENYKEKQTDNIEKLKLDNDKVSSTKNDHSNTNVSKKNTQEKFQKHTSNKYKSKVLTSIGESLESLAPPRIAGTINVTFTPREFPTAARESKKEEEEEWLAKQAEARRCIEMECEDLSPEERNPIWLKDKGDEFYSKHDYRAAINAYTLAIKLCPNLASLYSSRAACHLQIRNLHKVIEDISRALELLTPTVEENSLTRLECHIRRGTAFCKLKMYVEGLADYEAALKIDPKNKELLDDAAKIRKHIQGVTD